jgi:catechol 2,3-dioxygenase-like lactoylglutathione lyase family enzyme
MLAVADIAAGVAFYGRLGFAEQYRDDDTAVLVRDAVTLHLWRCADRVIADNTACRMQVAGIDALYAECRAAGAVHPNGPLRLQPWGLREFTVLDPQGGAITFFEPRAD